MKTTYITCDGCGGPWPGDGDGGTPPGMEIAIRRGTQDAHLVGGHVFFPTGDATEVLHFCRKDCIAKWADPAHQRPHPWPVTDARMTRG